MKKQSQSGFAVFELVVVVFILIAVAAVGYFVWHGHHKGASNANTPGLGYHSTATSVPTAPQVNSASDLNSAMSALNQADLSSSNTDSSQLNTQVSGF